MGLLATIKGWLNIGGVKVLLWKYKELSTSQAFLEGAVLFKTKSDKTVTSLEVKVIEVVTTTEGSGEEKTTDTETKLLGAIKFPAHDPGIGYPLELKAGQDREQPFSVDLIEMPRARAGKGVMGGIGKLAAFASGEKVEYFLVAEANVQGSIGTASDKQKLKIVE